MIRPFLVLLICGLLFSCDSLSQRKLLVQELKNIKAALASKNKEKIAGIFEFPVADTALEVYIDDTTYLEDLKKNGDKTTKALFLKYFQGYYLYMGMDGMNRVFKYINVDSLLQKNSLSREVRSPKEPCYTTYEVYVEKDIMTLIYNSNSNKNYVNPSKAKKDEDYAHPCEYAMFWVFRFDGKKLHFVRQRGAG